MKSLIHPSVGHVITNSVDWIQRPNVKTLFSMDTKFRVDYGEAWFSESIAEYLHIKLKGFANSQHTNFGIPTSAFDRFLDMVSQTLSEKEEEIVSSDDPPIAPLTGRDRAYLSWILNKFVVTCTDKNASRFAFTCKHYYGQRLQEIVRSTSYNALSAAQVEDRFDQCTRFTEASGLVKYVQPNSEDELKRGMIVGPPPILVFILDGKSA